MQAALVYPHQLFHEHPALLGVKCCVLIEDPLFFRQYYFHAQKLYLHRASMQRYGEQLRKQGMQVYYVAAQQLTSTGDITSHLKKLKIQHVSLVHPNDDWLQRRLTTALQKAKIGCTLLNDPHFLTTHEQFAEFAAEKPKLFFTEFYIRQRRRLGILLDQRGQPSGGQWSFDPENRKKLPRSISIPATKKLTRSANFVRTEQEISQQFPQACGNLTSFNYPIDRTEAFACLNDFLDHRFQLFGDYEDAIHSDESVLFHSLLTPALNIGLLSPREVVDAALARADEVPLNSLEGFVRQVIGWREYIRGVYHILGRRQRGGNFWEHTQPIPTAFYTGETGVEPVDVVIRRVLRYAYCHHIERLMILGNFMLLCEINPNEVYRWFMELFIDAYDWVMVPNVYGMSQFADGGTITTKPYISGSSYVRRMSNFRSGSWCEIWDALYWRFIAKHRDFFASNPRMSVMVAQLDRMGEGKLTQHLQIAARYLERLYEQR